MPERRYLLMVEAREGGGVSSWRSVLVPGVGRIVSRDEAEVYAPELDPSRRRFLFYDRGDQTARFSRDDSSALLAIIAPETIWNVGEPLRLDLLQVLRDVIARPGQEGQGYEQPDPDLFPIPVGPAVARARSWFGDGEPDRVEHVLDDCVMGVGGRRHEDPPCYHVPVSALGLG